MKSLTTKLAYATFATSLTLGVFAQAQAQAVGPNEFVQQVSGDTLQAFKNDSAARNGDINAIQQIVNQKLMPHVDFAKTTRLAVGSPWRQASQAQKGSLVDGFKQTLIRTYSGAFKSIDSNTQVVVKPFRGDANAKDVVVYSTVSSASGPVNVNYRLEKRGDSWKVYDFSVEGIWLVQNYRNQFANEISRSGIDGLVKKLQNR